MAKNELERRTQDLVETPNGEAISLDRIKNHLTEQSRAELFLYGWQYRYSGKGLPEASELAKMVDVAAEIAARAIAVVTEQLRCPAPYRRPELVYRQHYSYHVARRKSAGKDPESTLKELVATSKMCERTIARYRQRHSTDTLRSKTKLAGLDAM